MPCYNNRPWKRILSGIFHTSFFIITLPYAFISKLFGKDPRTKECIDDWLTKKITPEEAELNINIDGMLSEHPGKKQLSELVAKMQENDELWEFTSPPDTWNRLCGRAGICLVRNGKVIDSFITMMN